MGICETENDADTLCTEKEKTELKKIGLELRFSQEIIPNEA